MGSSCFICLTNRPTEEALLVVHRERAVSLCRKCGRKMHEYAELARALEENAQTAKKGGRKK